MNSVLFSTVDPQHYETVSRGLRVLLLLLFIGQRHHQRAFPQPAESWLWAGARLCAHPQQQTDPPGLPVSAAQFTGESLTSVWLINSSLHVTGHVSPSVPVCVRPQIHLCCGNHSLGSTDVSLSALSAVSVDLENKAATVEGAFILQPPKRVKQTLPALPADLQPTVGVAVTLRREEVAPQVHTALSTSGKAKTWCFPTNYFIKTS